jgi:UDP-GlcNAc:undecaprenyl-phosphate GlcNAc-1-phosphate transferase
MTQNLIYACLTAFLMVIFSIPSILTIAKEKHLYDEPSERKRHVVKTPRLGGLAIFVSFIFAIALWGQFEKVKELQFILAALLLLFFSGLKDDIIVIAPIKKLAAQVIASGIILFKTNLLISSFHGVFGIHELPLAVAYFITLFTLIVVCNAYNLIDGADGLAGSLGLVVCVSFGSLFTINNDLEWAMIAFTLAAALLGFLFYNFQPAKIFMGDAGSLIVGFMLALFSIHFLEMNIQNFGYTDRMNASPGMVIAILIVPLYDTLRIFILRIKQKKSPFHADHNHLHHQLMKLGLNHRQIALSLSFINIGFIVLAWLIQKHSAHSVTLVIGLTALVVGQIPVFVFRHHLNDKSEH